MTRYSNHIHSQEGFDGPDRTVPELPTCLFLSAEIRKVEMHKNAYAAGAFRRALLEEHTASFRSKSCVYRGPLFVKVWLQTTGIAIGGTCPHRRRRSYIAFSYTK